MPITIKTGTMKYKKPNGEYEAFNAVAQESTDAQIASIESAGAAQISSVQSAGATTIASIPNDYTTLTNNVSQLSEEIELADYLYNSTLSANSRWPRFALDVTSGTAYTIFIANVITAGTYDKVYVVQGSTDLTGNIPIGGSASFTPDGNDPVYLTVRFDTVPSVLPNVVYYFYPAVTGFRSVTGSGVAISTTNKSGICNGDCNDIPNNTIFGVNGDAALSHNPGLSGYYNILTVGKASIHTAGDTQIAFDRNDNMRCRNYITATSGWAEWKNISNGDSVGIRCGMSYVESSSVTDGKAKHTNGSEGAGSTYMYATFSVTGKETIYVSGYHFANSYPLFIFYNSNDEYISSADLGNSGRVEYQYKTIVPYNAVKVIVNGQRSGTYGFGIPSIQKYNSDLSLNDVIKNRQKRRYLFIGDSYCEGYSHDGNNSGWAVYCAEYMQMESTDYVRKYKGGARFSANGSNNTFEALLMDTQYPFDYFTDIVVCGGYNDHSYTEQNVLDGISSFVTYAKLMYPTARIHIGFISWNKAGNGSGAEPNWETYRQHMVQTTLPAYQKCVEYGVEYMNNVEYWLGESGLTSSDGYHPSETGNRSIARAVANALLTGSAPLPYANDLRLP